MSLRRALSIVWRARGPVAGLALVVIPLGIAFSTCLVGVVPLVYGLGKLASVLVASARGADAPRSGSVRGAGVAALIAIAIVGALMLIGGSSAGLLAESTWVRLTGALVAAALVGAALAPFLLAPFALADGAGGLSRSVELSARLGARRVASLGAVASGLVAATVVLLDVLFRPGFDVEPAAAAALAIPVAAMPSLPVAGALLASAYVEASSGAELDGEPLPATRRLRALGLVLVPALSLVACVLVGAALTPTPMRGLRVDAAIRRGIHPQDLAPDREHRSLPGADVHLGPRGVVIEAPDGGGAGAVGARFDTRGGALYVDDGARHGGARGTYAVIVTSDDARAFTIVDARGVRQDDSLVDRVFGRLGGVGTVALFAGLALLLVLAFKLASDLGQARALSAPDLRERGRRRVLAALEGTLRLGEGAALRPMHDVRVHVDGGVHVPRPPFLSVHGDAWLDADGGAFRFRIPEGFVPTLGPPREASDGAPAVLLSRFERVSPAGLREATAAWPDDARLVIGRRADAIAALVARATSAAAWIALPALVALIAAAARLLLAL